MSTFAEITNAIYDVFEPLVGRKNIYIDYDNGRPVSAEISSKTLPKCNFLELYFTANKNIHVESLKNCKETRMGQQLLNLVENLARRIGSNEITLIDMSKLIIEPGKTVSLITLYNLTTGQSWYNKLGYICKEDDFNHDEAFESNKATITTMSVSDFASKENDTTTRTRMNQLLKEIKIQFPELDPKKTIQEYFIIVKDKLQQYSDGSLRYDVNLLTKLIELFQHTNRITTYNTNDCLLVKKMEALAGGKKQKKHLSRKPPKTIKTKARRTKRKPHKTHKKNKTKRK